MDIISYNKWRLWHETQPLNPYTRLNCSLSFNDKFTNNGRRSFSWSYLLSDSSVQGGMWNVFYSTARKEADWTMDILMVSLAILLCCVIGAVPVSAQNTVSYDKQISDIIFHQKAFPSPIPLPLSNILHSLNKGVQYCEEVLGTSKCSHHHYFWDIQNSIIV